MIQVSVEKFLKRVNDETHNANTFSSSIYTAPPILRDLSPSAFDPRVVSIGPLHREKENLQAFEGQKVSCVNKLLSRTGVSKEKIVESCMEKVHASMEQIKAYYVWNKAYTEPEIAEMMVMDACFILDFIYWYSGYDESYSKNRLLSQTMIFDLVLLENQIPLFILDQIYQCTILKNHYVSLIKFIYPVLRDLKLFKEDFNIPDISTNAVPHILSLLHECYKPPSNIESTYFSSTMHSAVHLDKAGVKFKPNKDPTWKMQMEVKLNRLPPCCLGSWSKPTLKIPVFHVHDFTEVILRNLIAYEQSHQTRNYIISYAWVMDMLVNTQEDVTRLVDSEVLVNEMGSDEEAAKMINSICKNVTCLDFFYKQECEKLTTYCNAYWPKNIVKLKRTYFSSPWNIIALVAGIILFALTVTQTIFNIKSAK